MKLKLIILITCLMFSIWNLKADEHDKHKTTDHDIHECENHKGHENDSTFSQILEEYGFSPSFSFVMDLSYIHRNISQQRFEALEFPGFTSSHSGHEEESHSHGAQEEGFNLNYGEISFGGEYKSIFSIFANLHLSEDSVSIEEAYLSTLSLPYHLKFKFGKFFSHFGYFNRQHAHAWNFSDQPLIHKLMMGEEGLLEKGIQVEWRLPGDNHFHIGGELLQGGNETSFSSEGFLFDDILVDDVKKPNITVIFAGFSFHKGSAAIHGSISVGKGDMRQAAENDEHEEHLTFVSGTTDLTGFDFRIEFEFENHNTLSIGGEYIGRKINGTGYSHDFTGPYKTDQSGFYTEVLYSLHDKWTFGFRHESFCKNDILFEKKHTYGRVQTI